MSEQLKIRKKKQEARGILSALGLNFFGSKKLERVKKPQVGKVERVKDLRQDEIDFLNAELGKETSAAKQALIRMQIRTLEQYRDVMRTFEVKSLAQGRKMVSEARQQAELESKQKIEERLKLVWGDTYPTFDRVRKLKADLKDLEFGASKLFLELKKNGGQTFEEAYNMMRDEIGKVESELQTLQIDNSTEALATDILSYKEDLAREGHIAQVGSVKNNIEEMKLSMTVGRPVFIYGPTGTGKTSLAHFAAKQLTGQKAYEINCNPQTREQNIIGKTGIELKDGQPVTKFDIGIFLKAAKEGRFIIFDEYTSLPDSQMSMLKGHLNKQPGDTININGYDPVTISQGFLCVFTSNLRDPDKQRNLERSDLPPEQKNEFHGDSIKVLYPSPEESWQIFLARIIDDNGDAEFSEYDLVYTIPRLLNSMQVIQDSYNGTIDYKVAEQNGATDAGKVKGLKSLVMSQRDIRGIIEKWKIVRRKDKALSFTEFLDKFLQTIVLNDFYTTEERKLCANFLIKQKLLRTLSERDLGFSIGTFASFGFKQIPKDELLQSSKVRKWNIKGLSELDPFGVRKKQTVSEVATALDLSNIPNTVLETKTGIPTDYAEQMKFLEGVYKNNWNYDAKGKIENGTAIQTDISQVNYGSADRLDVTESKFGQVEFIEQLGNPPDFETSIPESFDVTSTDVKKPWINPKTKTTETNPATGKPFTQKEHFEQWKSQNNIKTNKYCDVMNYFAQTYGDTHYLPGLDYMMWVLETQKANPNHPVLGDLKKNSYSFLPGTLFRLRYGDLNVPFLGTGGGVLKPSGGWLGSDWDSSYRVVLLPKP